MANYIGNQLKNGEFKKLDDISSSFNGTTTTFNLQFNGTSVNAGGSEQLVVSLNGVIQEPDTAYSLATAGSQIVFSSAPSNGSTCFIMLFGGIGALASQVADNTITTAKIADSAVHDVKINSMSASKLTGALPAIDGSSLTGIDALPSQTGESGNYLTTDGSTASWAALDTDANSTTKGLYEHSATISTSYTIGTGNNAMSSGPVELDTGVTVTIPSGSTWTIV